MITITLLVCGLNSILGGLVNIALAGTAASLKKVAEKEKVKVVEQE